MTTAAAATRPHTIGLLVQNHAGVLARIAGLIGAKGYNIESLSVGVTQTPELSRITLVVRGDDLVLEQALKQLDRLIDVVEIEDLTALDRVDRELVLVRVATDSPDDRAEVTRAAEIFRANVVDVCKETMTLALTGGPDKIEAFVELLSFLRIDALYRTGRVAMARARQRRA